MNLDLYVKLYIGVCIYHSVYDAWVEFESQQRRHVVYHGRIGTAHNA